MSRRLKLCWAAALLFLVGTIGMTAWFYYAPHRAVTRLHQALRSSDTNALAREIDFPAFQASLKQQINLVVTNKLDRAFDNAMREYRSGSQFVIYLTGQRGETTELILEREGLRWQL